MSCFVSVASALQSFHSEVDIMTIYFLLISDVDFVDLAIGEYLVSSKGTIAVQAKRKVATLFQTLAEHVLKFQHDANITSVLKMNSAG